MSIYNHIYLSARFFCCNVNLVTSLIIVSALLAFLSNVEAQTSCSTITPDGVRVCHNTADTSVFYQTPKNEVAYAIQVVHDGDRYDTVYHAEPPGGGLTGDSIKAGFTSGHYTFALPAHGTQLVGPPNDPQSLMDGDGVGGGGNPIAIKGLPGDNYFYVFFIGVSDDDRTRNKLKDDWRHYLLEARTNDFHSFDIKSDDGWVAFSGSAHPASLRDPTGAIIRSNIKRMPGDTQGLISSISYVHGTYHYFYFRLRA